jgi:8-oxo-dGTP pyrophosphatase MutT (NUDIX family)
MNMPVPNAPPNPWRTLESNEIYRNPWLRLREDKVIRPDGNPGIYGVVEFRPSVGILALDEQDRVALVGQWRYPKGRFLWEIPLGASHEGEQEMEQTARRELREETGVEASHWTRIGTVDSVIGATTDEAHVYLATGLTRHAPRHDPEESIVVSWVEFNEALRMVLDGEITEAVSTAAILRYALKFKLNSDR